MLCIDLLFTWLLLVESTNAQPRSRNRLAGCIPLDFTQLGSVRILSTNGMVPRIILWEALQLNSDSTLTVPRVRIIRTHQLCQSDGPTRGTFSSIGILIEYECLGSACLGSDNPTFIHHFAFDCDSATNNWNFPYVSSSETTAPYHFNMILNPLGTFSTPMESRCGYCSVNRNSSAFLFTFNHNPITLCSLCYSSCATYGGRNMCNDYFHVSSACCNFYTEDDFCTATCHLSRFYRAENYVCRPYKTCNAYSDTDLYRAVGIGTSEFSNVTIYCKSGYVPSTPVVSFCGNGTWRPPLESICNAVIETCNAYSNTDIYRAVGAGTTSEFSNVTIHCNNGYVPSTPVHSFCENGAWRPPLESICSLLAANVTLTERRFADNTDCPGSEVTYNCTIESNAETLNLNWRVYPPPGGMPVITTYVETTTNRRTNIRTFSNLNITTRLSGRTADHMSSTLSILLYGPVNGTQVECSIDRITTQNLGRLASASKTLLFTFLGPPTHHLDILNTRHFDKQNVVLLAVFSQKIPIYTASYILTSFPRLPSNPIIAPSTAFNLTLRYNQIYRLTLRTRNCNGARIETYQIKFVNCSWPVPPGNGTTGIHDGLLMENSTWEGAITTFQCNDGYVPSIVRTTTCMGNASWYPLPQEHICTKEEATVELSLRKHNKSKECPGDTISYNCSITSNTESPHLIWHVALPGDTPITYIYDNTSNTERRDSLARRISVFTRYWSESELNYRKHYIESTIVLTVLRNVSLNQTKLECAITDLGNVTKFVLANTAVPSGITSFSIYDFYPRMSDVTVTLTWDTPADNGTEVIVDNYTISIVSHPTTNVVMSPPWNVTLDYNMNYTATIIAVNCFGKSNPFILSNIRYDGCSPLLPPVNGHLRNYVHSGVGVIVSYQCNAGFIPYTEENTTCREDHAWHPDPQEHSCILDKSPLTVPLSVIIVIPLVLIVLMVMVFAVGVLVVAYRKKTRRMSIITEKDDSNTDEPSLVNSEEVSTISS